MKVPIKEYLNAYILTMGLIRSKIPYQPSTISCVSETQGSPIIKFTAVKEKDPINNQKKLIETETTIFETANVKTTNKDH